MPRGFPKHEALGKEKGCTKEVGAHRHEEHTKVGAHRSQGTRRLMGTWVHLGAHQGPRRGTTIHLGVMVHEGARDTPKGHDDSRW
jgi:hypothetical protein